MSIAFERNSGDSVQYSGYTIHRMPSRFPDGTVFPIERRFPDVERRRMVEKVEKDNSSSSSSSSSSSIGRNSDDDYGEELEVQSSYKGPLDTMNDLEEGLHVKRGISKFYSGKSKSFTSLSDASSASSIKELIKPENPYTRKRKNLLTRNTLWDDKNRSHPTNDNGSCSMKRTVASNGRALAFGSTLVCTKSSDTMEDIGSMPSSVSCCLPPLHPHGNVSSSKESCSPPLGRQSNWRSFSLSDLQCCATSDNRV